MLQQWQTGTSKVAPQDMTRRRTQKLHWIAQLPVLLAAVAYLGLALILVLLALNLRRRLCPAEAWVVGSAQGYSSVLAAFLLAATPFVLAGFPNFRVRISLLAIVSFGWWLDGALTYSCATTVEIVDHPGLFSHTSSYVWNDVRSAWVRCSGGRYNRVSFELHMNDGRIVDLGGPGWASVERHFGAITRALSHAPVIPDPLQYGRCPKDVRDLFPSSPG